MLVEQTEEAKNEGVLGLIGGWCNEGCNSKPNEISGQKYFCSEPNLFND